MSDAETAEETQAAPFQFTDEEMAKAEERVEQRRREEGARRGAGATVAAGEPLSVLLKRLEGVAAQAEAEKRSLPCFTQAEAGDLAGAAATCRAAKGHEGDRDARGTPLGCRWRQQSEWCALERQGEMQRVTRELLTAAKVPKRLGERILASVPGAEPRRALAETVALRAARAFAAAPRATGCRLDDGTSVPFTGSEWVLALLGPVGTGKSIAAAYVVARAGGLWLPARVLSNPKHILEAAEVSPLLVIDDLGTEYSGASAYGLDRATELLELRHAEERRTVITSNLNETDLAARYGARLADRLRERGRIITAAGASLRGAA